MSSVEKKETGLPGHKPSDTAVVAEKNAVDGFTGYNEEQYYMSGPRLGLLIAGLCLALFLLGLDTAIVSTVSVGS